MAMQTKSRKSFDDNEERVSFENKGDLVEGYYLGSETFTKDADTLTKHRFKAKDGTIYSCLGGYVLNSDLSDIEIGVLVRVTYLGKSKSKKGRMFKNFEIQFDSEDRAAG